MGHTYLKNLFNVYLKFKLTGHPVDLTFELLLAQSGSASGTSSWGPGRAGHSCGLLSHAPEAKCLRSGLQEADLKMRMASNLFKEVLPGETCRRVGE